MTDPRSELEQVIAELDRVLSYEVPPGPPDPPKPKECPCGHLLHWMSPSVAICDGDDWEPAWGLVLSATGAKVHPLTTPAVLGLAYKLRDVVRLRGHLSAILQRSPQQEEEKDKP